VSHTHTRTQTTIAGDQQRSFPALCLQTTVCNYCLKSRNGTVGAPHKVFLLMVHRQYRICHGKRARNCCDGHYAVQAHMFELRCASNISGRKGGPSIRHSSLKRRAANLQAVVAPVSRLRRPAASGGASESTQETGGIDRCLCA